LSELNVSFGGEDLSTSYSFFTCSILRKNPLRSLRLPLRLCVTTSLKLSHLPKLPRQFLRR